MAVLSRDDFMNRLKERIGDDTSDTAIAFLEDITDTYDDMNNRLSDTTDWKAKYEQNDADWKAKYRERFFSKQKDDEHDDTDVDGGRSDAPKTFEDLFK